ncbi:MAG: rhomboid family intramembrane serine protease [Succinivibrionaceae bacterium]
MKAILKVNNYRLAEFFATRLDNKTKTKVRIQEDGENSYLLLVDEKDWEVCQKELMNIASEMRQFEQNEKKNNAEKWAANLKTSREIKRVPTQFSITDLKQTILSAPFTTLIFIICLIVFLCLAVSTENTFDLLSMNNISTGEPSSWYKLISPAVMNFSLTHIAFNLFWWYWLGSRIEKGLGTATLLAVFLLGSIIPNFIQYSIYGPNFGGLSGVNYALMSYVCTVTFLRPRQYSAVIMDRTIFTVAIVWAFLGFLIPAMANGAHFGGIFTGIAIGLYDIFVVKRNKL